MEARRPLTACIVTLDEERNIGPCLDSLAFCDEVVVLDAGSTDRTRAIAEARGARVSVRPWPGFAAQKNHAVDQATHDLVLCLDADERVTPPLRASIEAVRAADQDLAGDGWACAWETVYLGGPVRSDRGRARWKVRLYDRRRGRWTGSEPHAHVVVEGRVRKLDGALLHYTYRDLEHHAAKMNAWTTAAAQAMREGRRSAFAGMLLRAPWAFLRTYVLRGGFRDGRRGLVIAVMAAYYVFLKYAKLKDLRDRTVRSTAGRRPSTP